MLLDQLRTKEGLTNQESLLAEYILEHLSDIDAYSAAELAATSFVSKATVVRLAQKLGCSGYQELKVKLAVESHQKQHFKDLLKDEPITADTRLQDLIEIVPGIYDKSITNTNLTLSKQVVNRIANYLNQAKEIELYGRGITYHLAQAVAFKFQTFGRLAQAYDNVNDYYLAARSSVKRLAFLITFTGNNQSVIDMAQHLRERTDTYLVGIAGPYQEQLKEYCHEVVEIHNRDSLSSLDIISSFASCNYIFDLLFALLLTKQYHHQLEATLKVIEHHDKH